MPKSSKAYRTALICGGAAVLALAFGETALAQQTVDLAGATVVTRAGQLSKAEQTAAQVLVEKKTFARLACGTASQVRVGDAHGRRSR